jgi:hypothetical protein
MRTLSIVTLTTLIAAPLAAQGGNPADPDKKVAGGGTLPAGWSAHLDQATASLSDVKFAPMGGGFHVTTGPAVILWKETDTVNGPFHTLATFTQTKAPTHPEAYGIIIGGKDLKSATPTYLYFIVRGDGKFMINKMGGGTRTTLVPWTDNEAIVKQDATTGKATNKLEIDGKVDPSKIAFKVNGKVVHEIPSAGTDIGGAVGLRVNHNLDVHIDGFAVHKL